MLAGGVANAGAVVRRGDHVLRPSNPHTASIHRFLTALRAAGFEGASEPVGIEPDGRERLVFIPGEVAVPPYPDWFQTDEALTSIADLLRRFHDAARAFDPTAESWSDELADPGGGPIVVHADVCPENVVFSDGVAVGFLDFDFAAPGRPVYDLAAMVRMCGPVDDELSAGRLGWGAVDQPARLRLAADTYGLDGAGRRELLAVLDDVIAGGGRSSSAEWRRATPTSSPCGRRWAGWSATTAVVAGGRAPAPVRVGPGLNEGQSSSWRCWAR